MKTLKLFLSESISAEDFEKDNPHHPTEEQQKDHDSLTEYHKTNVAGKISSHEKEHLSDYSGSGSQFTNKRLLLGEFPFGVEHIDGAIKRSRLPHDVETASGLGFDPREHGMKEVGDKLHLKAFTSTSLKPAVAREFANDKIVERKNVPGKGEFDIEKNHMVFHLKKGQSALYMSAKSEALSRHGEREHEILLPRNINAKLIKKEEHTRKHLTGKIIHHVYHVEIEPHEEH